MDMVISSVSFLLEKFSSIFHLSHYSNSSAFIFLFFPFTPPAPALSLLLHFETLIYVTFLLFDSVFSLLFFLLLFHPYPEPHHPFHFFFVYPPLIFSAKSCLGPLTSQEALTKRLRKTRYYVLSYTFCNRPSNLVTTVQFKPGLKATKIAPNAN